MRLNDFLKDEDIGTNKRNPQVTISIDDFSTGENFLCEVGGIFYDRKKNVLILTLGKNYTPHRRNKKWKSKGYI